MTDHERGASFERAEAVRFTVSLPFEDYLAANWLMVRRRWLWRGAAKFVAIVGFAYALIMMVFDVAAGSSIQLRIVLDIGLALALALGALLVMFLVWKVTVPRAARKTYDQLGTLGHPVAYAYDRTGFSATNAESSTKLDWSRLYGWTENATLLLLFRTQMLFFGVPKDQVDTAIVDDLRQTLLTAGVKKR